MKVKHQHHSLSLNWICRLLHPPSIFITKLQFSTTSPSICFWLSQLIKLKLFQKQLQNVNLFLLCLLPPFFGALLCMVVFAVFTFQVSLLQKLPISLPRILTWESMIFLAMLQIHVSFKIHFPLNSVMFPKNCNMNWLNCSMTQFCTAAATRKLSVMFVL